MLAPEDELLHSNVARVLAPIANRAPDGPLRSDVPRSVAQLLAWRRPVGEINKREAIAIAQAVLERAVELAPLEHENRLALEIVHRTLAELGEPGHRERADEQLRLQRRLRPAGDVG
ncbi:MAG TPA: hypothetical protein VG370_08275 [Chloroflexota bacterium]|nr:hypothetical protein [Chloroflexota bacterium]